MKGLVTGWSMSSYRTSFCMNVMLATPGSDVAARVCEADCCVLDQAVGGSCDGRAGSMKDDENCTYQTRHLSLSSWPVLKIEPAPSCSARAPFLRSLP